MFPKQSRGDSGACQRGIQDVVAREVEMPDVQSFEKENTPFERENTASCPCDGSLLG